ncbi:helix-turn-helix domain-containing protein [Romboutsia sp.]|uniref:helix-turn-helix domain-containing protein n=1 Tax=Romboutsia sp. TaxID=1965302 RepID=UPI003F3349A5
MEDKINQLMQEYSITFNDLATRLGVGKQTLTRKIKGTTEWTYPEMMSLIQIFNIKDPQQFFFNR